MTTISTIPISIHPRAGSLQVSGISLKDMDLRIPTLWNGEEGLPLEGSTSKTEQRSIPIDRRRIVFLVASPIKGTRYINLMNHWSKRISGIWRQQWPITWVSIWPWREMCSPHPRAFARIPYPFFSLDASSFKRYLLCCGLLICKAEAAKWKS